MANLKTHQMKPRTRCTNYLLKINGSRTGYFGFVEHVDGIEEVFTKNWCT